VRAGLRTRIKSRVRRGHSGTLEPHQIGDRLLSDAQRAELLRRMSQAEDNFVERKSAARRQEVLDTVVSFANSVPLDREAILFLGVGPDRAPVGLADADKTQRDVRQWTQTDAFPPINTITCEALPIDGKEILAVIVRASPDRPHFSGHAYIRVGSETVKASRAILDELIASRNTKTGRILQFKGQRITVECIGCDIDGQTVDYYLRTPVDCTIEGCDAFSVQLLKEDAGRHVSIPLDDVDLSHDSKRHRGLMLLRFPTGRSRR
jgi:Putative DNA-binding domain